MKCPSSCYNILKSHQAKLKKNRYPIVINLDRASYKHYNTTHTNVQYFDPFMAQTSLKHTSN